LAFISALSRGGRDDYGAVTASPKIRAARLSVIQTNIALGST
jgi:hypothetical protein